jgi:thiol-disulfide isomerase/thioredoxin
MKGFFVNIILFIALSIIFSSLTACSSEKNNGENSVEISKSNANSKTTEKKKIEYPEPPQGLAQAENKMLDGSIFKLADKKGKVILLNLWATWCGPCRAEMPEFVAMQEKYRDKNFEIIGLDVDPEGEQEIKDFAAKMKLNYQLGWAFDSLVSEFSKITNEKVIPQSILFDRDGKMRGVFIGGGNKNINKIKESVEKTVNE